MTTRKTWFVLSAGGVLASWAVAGAGLEPAALQLEPRATEMADATRPVVTHSHTARVSYGASRPAPAREKLEREVSSVAPAASAVATSVRSESIVEQASRALTAIPHGVPRAVAPTAQRQGEQSSVPGAPAPGVPGEVKHIPEAGAPQGVATAVVPNPANARDESDLEERLTEEVADDDWSAEVEQYLRETSVAVGLDPSIVQSTDCAETVCRVQLEFPSFEGMAAFQEAAQNPGLDYQGTPEPVENGGFSVLLFIHKPEEA